MIVDDLVSSPGHPRACPVWHLAFSRVEILKTRFLAQLRVLTPIWTIFLLRVSCIRSAVKLTSCISPLYAGTGWETGLESVLPALSSFAFTTLR